MKEDEIRNAYVRIRTIDQTIPDDVLDFMKDASISALSAIKEQLDWDEAFDKYDGETPTFLQNQQMILKYLKANYSLIPKPKPCNENTTTDAKN